MKTRNLLIIFVLLYVGSLIYLLDRAISLEFNGDLIALLPSNNNYLSSYNKLEDLNSSEGGFTLIIHSTDNSSVVGAATLITQRLLELKDSSNNIFRSAELENDLYDIRSSALYLMTKDELDQLYQDVDEYIQDQKRDVNPLYVEFDEEEDSDLSLDKYSSVLLEDVTKAKRYSISEDSTVISVLFLTNFPKSDYNQLEKTYSKLLSEKAVIESDFENIELFWGGSYVNHYDKINDIQFAVTKALIIGVLSLILFLFSYMAFVNRTSAYRKRYIIVDLLLIFFILFSGFGIALGLASFFFSEINVFTGIIFSILFGINLDYILHLYAVNKERKLDNGSISTFIISYLSSTKPILLSCLTTGLAILSLIFADFQGFIQFGIIFFINIIVNLISTYMFLLVSPSISKSENQHKSSYDSNALLLIKGNQKSRSIGLSLFIILVAFGSYTGSKALSFNFSFSELEPKSKSTQYKVLNSETKSGSSNYEPSYFITSNIEESKALFNEISEGLGSKYEDIAKVESFSARYPINKTELALKSSKIDSIKQLLDRNDEFFKNLSSETEEFIDIAKSSVAPTIDTLPKYIKNRFFFKDGSMAPLVVMYPAYSLSDGQRSIRFRKSSGSISIASGKTFYAASTSIIASSILELLIQESTFLFVVPLCTIIILLLIYYRSVFKAVLAATPLLLTFGMLLSIRSAYAFDINLYNVIVFPIIIGVGADNGIHLVDSLIHHRSNFIEYFLNKKFPILAACSITTVLGFIGLLFINHPGMESIGILAVVGISVTLLATYLTSLYVQVFYLKQ